jgi:lipopolysaccharide export system permease protein
MRLHDRYLFRELLTPLAVCLGGFLIFWVFVFFFRELDKIEENQLNLLETAEYCAASLPEFFVMLLPILLLLALLYALTHHARHNEITALRAAGVSLWRVCAPYFVVGLAATGIYFATNEIAVPRGNRWADEILNRHAKKETAPKNNALKGFRNARANRGWTFTDYDPRTTQMLNPTVEWTQPDGSWHTLQAARAVRTNGVWTFFDVQYQTRQAGPHAMPVRMPSTNVLTIPTFDETPEKIRLLLKFGDTHALHGSSTADIPLAELWELLQSKAGLSAEDEHAWETKFHGRIAAPWTCFVVVLMAIPFGAQTGRRNLFFGVAGSIFICFAYFVLQKISLAFGMNGHLSGWLAAWLPNFIFAAAGIFLTWRAR